MALINAISDSALYPMALLTTTFFNNAKQGCVQHHAENLHKSAGERFQTENNNPKCNSSTGNICVYRSEGVKLLWK